MVLITVIICFALITLNLTLGYKNHIEYKSRFNQAKKIIYLIPLYNLIVEDTQIKIINNIAKKLRIVQ